MARAKIMELIDEQYGRVREVVAQADLHGKVAVLEVRDVLPPGSLESWEYVHQLLAGESWARMRIVDEGDRAPQGWGWYRAGEIRGHPSRFPGEPWVKISGYGIDRKVGHWRE